MSEKTTGMLVGAAAGCLLVYMFFGDWSDQNSGKLIGFACGSLATYMFTNTSIETSESIKPALI